MDREKGNGNTVLLTVIGVATLLVALVGATFAYFSATITNEAKESVIITTAAPVGLEYLGSKIELLNIIPGENETGTFTVTNPAASTVEQTYDLHLVIDENQLVTTDGDDQLEVAITSAVTTAGTDADGNAATTTMNAITNSPYNLTDGAATKGQKLLIVDDQRIAIGEVQTYTVTVTFKDLDVAQDTNQGKNFQAHIEISDPVSVK